MKKFLIFLVAIISTVCIGVTFYQFAKNDEVIKVNTATIYINYGETLSLEEIGFSRTEPSKSTKIDFNAGGDEVTSIIKYDALTKSYIPTSKGGATTIKISTTNRKYKSFSIDVMVGIGSEEFPYYISNEQQLFDICNQHIDDNASFELVQNIQLTKTHNPIGLIDGKYREFTGKFNGGYFTISGLTIESCDYAGLFAILGANSEVYNLNLSNAVIEGSFIHVGTVAGICYGNINKVVISNSTISNNKTSSNTGAVVGLLQSDKLHSTTAGIFRTSAFTDENKTLSANGYLGGIAGSVDSAVIHACLTNLSLKNTSNLYTGGLVGKLTVNPDTYIRESYSISKIQAPARAGNIIGTVEMSNNSTSNINKELVLVGLYYDKTLNNFAGVASDTYGFSTITSFAVNGKTTEEMKNKDTFIYYISSSNNIVYWDKVWYLVNGHYPTLIFLNNFDDILLEDIIQLPTQPEDSTTPDISNPEQPSTSTSIISNKNDLLTVFQKSTAVSGNYILAADIDLGGMKWTPVEFTGTFKSNTNNSHTISNFEIVGNNLPYAGFFYTLSTATITNIIFNNVTTSSTTLNDCVGLVVGLVKGNTVISNVDVINSSINSSAKYAGGIAGYIANICQISNCQLQNISITNSVFNAGGITGYSAKNTYIYNCHIKNSNQLSGVDRIGGIVAVNYGTINYCSYEGTIEANSIYTTAGYFGGLCGINYSKIYESTSFAEISTTNNSTSKAYYFVGGLCGYNNGDITYCGAYADEYSAGASSSVIYLGGLTAYNSGKLEYNVVNTFNIGSVNNNIYVAGLSVYNYGGNIYGCFAFANLSGYQVAGLVRTNTNNGTVDSCITGLTESDRSTFKGVQVTSFAYDISSGTISNCLVNANLNCTNSNGWIAGFAGFMPYTNNKFGTISYSIANVSFNGLGNKYLDIAQGGLMKKQRTTGTISNCIISSDANIKGVIESDYSSVLWNKQEPGSNSNYIIANEAKLQNIETYLDPNNCNFDISAGLSNSKWLYVINKMPVPRTFVEVFGYDIISL